MSTDPLATLRKHRSALLACEALGWFHMAGKAHPDFLRGHGGQSKYDFKKTRWSGLQPEVDKRLSWLKTAAFSGHWPDPLSAFWTEFDKNAPKKEPQKYDNIVGLLQAAHAMASGIEKNHPRATSGYLGQDVTHMWRSSPFGHPERNLLADPPPVLEPTGPASVAAEVARILDDLSTLQTASDTDIAKWASWRDAAIGPASTIRQSFLDTLAETRLPNNDVTLWDQSYIAAALFKSAVAGALLAGNTNWQGLKPNTRWRVLTVGLGAEHYEARAVRIGDWTGARADIDAFFDRVCKLVEVDLALGGLVYRDSETLAFTFPGERLNGAGSVTDACAEDLRAALAQQIDRLASDLDTPPDVRLSTSTRSFIAMAAQLRDTREAVRIPLHRAWTAPPATRQDGNPERDGHTCSVCLVRRNGTWNDKQAPCAVCRRRRGGRLDAWLADGVDQDTIWISELADHTDRVAMLTFSLGIDRWVDGSELDSLRSQSIAEWAHHNRLGKGINTPEDYASMVRLMATAMPKTGNDVTKARKQLLNRLSNGFAEHKWPDDFGESLVSDRSEIQWAGLTDEDRAAWLAHQLFRKNASPGRIHRLWRSAEAFFADLLAGIRERTAAHDNRWRVRRLVLKATGGTWKDRETYHGAWRNAPLGLLYRKDTDDFVTITNLARCLGPTETHAALRGQTIGVRGDDAGQPVQLTVTEVEDKVGPLGVYHPIVPLELGPRRFRVLVPLDAVDDIARLAVTRWGEAFSRVWDRLPIQIGVVAFPRMTPFQAVIEAARNLEDDLAADPGEVWRVADVGRRDGVIAVQWARPNGEPELTATPTRLPDGRDDAHYPYVHVERSSLRDPRDFQHPDGRVYRHIADLKPGDGVHVQPSRFATTFLDSTARRFHAADVGALSEVARRDAVWALVQDHAPSMSAVRDALSAIEDARERWLTDAPTPAERDTWLAFARSVLHDKLDARGAALDALVDAARTGVLVRSLRWHLQVLKQGLESTS